LLWTAALRAEEKNSETIALGATIYVEHCAACHGADLAGQPNWQVPLSDGRMLAPPLDGSGHAQHHSEIELFQDIKMGMAAMTGKPSDMPAFGSTLSDVEILAVIAYFKSTWCSAHPDLGKTAISGVLPSAHEARSARSLVAH
jgi:mono/diheme cytochrome c family protein